MSLSTEERANLEVLEEELDEMAYEQSVEEVDSLTAFLRIYHWLSTFNQSNELRPSASGGITLSDTMLETMAYGFIKNTHARPQTFLIHLQQHEYDLLSALTIQAAWLEPDAVCILFKAVKYADYLIPPLRLSFKIISPVVYKKVVEECDFLTICLITESELNLGRYTVLDVHNPVAPLFKEAPSPRSNTQSFMKAFT
ncbi:hypothetical protein [Psychrobacter sp. AOP31-A1-22]|uniref:hypothetical protein n=1 Tax=Psychrobacter sp. AOP31-A1-22 TaxID=3457696 RepID=UPI00403511AA